MKLVNWGFWQDTGLGARPGLAAVLRQRGIHPVAPPEGVEGFTRIFASSETQVFAARVEPSALEAAGLLPASPAAGPMSGFDLAHAEARKIALAGKTAWPGLEQGYHFLRDCTRRLLLKRLIDLGAFGGRDELTGVADIRNRLKVLPEFTPLLAALLDILHQAGILLPVDDHYSWAVDIWTAPWPQRLAQAEADIESASVHYPDFAAHFRLLRHCLASYGEVLRGEKSPLELLFPKASFELMTPIYRGNRPADVFNAMTAASICDYVRAIQGKGMIRIIEAGAGTGSTTEVVLAALESLEVPIEYHITDVSLQFTEHLRDTLGARFKSCRFAALNVENPIAAQGVRT